MRQVALGLLLGCLSVVGSPAATAALSCEIVAGGCDELLQANASKDISLIATGQPPERYAGKTLCIQAGTYRYFFARDLRGSPEQAVTLSNCGGQVTFSANSGSSMKFYGSRYVHLTGSGDPALPYGLVVHHGGSSSGYMVEIGYGSSDFEIDHLEIKGNPLSYDAGGAPVLTGGIGLSFKTYPKCEGNLWSRDSFTQFNSLIHDNYIHDTRWEGIYLGTSHNGWITANNYTPGWNCGGYRLIEADLVNAEVVANRLENIGSDAIQVGGSGSRTLIQGNHVYNYGLRQEEAHASAIQIGPGTKARVENNWLENPLPNTRVSQGIKHLGLGDTYVINNVVIGARNGLQLLRNTDVNFGLNLPDT